uniref:Uncharacterized protein n=1 Tax=Aegilops tauschii subsp. strangulata TaxID=200361 RepID=A0A453P6P5_AEGTS
RVAMDVIAPDRTKIAPEIEKDEALEGDRESDPALASTREWQFEAMPRWQDELTVRGMVAALLIGFIYTVIVMKIALTTGLVPTLNVSAALLSFLALRGWTRLLDRFGIVSRPFTRQENTIVQTCGVACYTIAFAGGFGSTLLGLNKKTYELAGDSPGNVPGSWKEPGIGWMTGFLLACSFGGLLTLIPLRQEANPWIPEVLWGFYFDFSMTYVGAGMICPHIVNISTLLGAIISWGIMWPLISKHKGDWYPAKAPESSMKSLYGYKAFICIALIMGDGMYHFIKIVGITAVSMYRQFSRKQVDNKAKNVDDTLSLEEFQRQEIFKRGHIPSWMAYTGYALFSVLAVVTIPVMFKQVKWYYVVIAYVVAPMLGFANSYGTGLTDINMGYNYGKIALFVFAGWAGKDNGVIAGLVAGTLVKQLVLISADLMQDFKTGYLTQTSPKSMMIAQVIGTAMGCIISPLTFMLFYKAFDIGNPDGTWKAPYALIYRNMAILGVEGFSVLPKYCIAISGGFFAFAAIFSIARDVMPHKYAKYVPLPMAMAVPFLVGGSFAIDMCLGSLIVFAWTKINKKEAGFMVPAVASALICGDGIWTFPASILALAKIKPPICMKFLPAA